jgi:hypothetical protein
LIERQGVYRCLAGRTGITSVYHDRDSEEELALVALTRRQVARVLKLVPAQAWQRTAVHTEGGLVTLRQLVLHATRHLKHHVRFVEEKRRALAPGRVSG